MQSTGSIKVLNNLLYGTEKRVKGGPVPSLLGARGAVPPQTSACAPPFRFTQNTFLEHHVTIR